MTDRNTCGKQIPNEVRGMIQLPPANDYPCGREPLHKGPCKLHIEDDGATLTVAWKVK